VSTRELSPHEHEEYADLSCKLCEGTGYVTTWEPVYRGQRWCICAVANRKRIIELDLDPSGPGAQT